MLIAFKCFSLAFPYILQTLTAIFSGVLASWMIKKGYQISNVRCLCQTSGMFGPAIILILAMYAAPTTSWAIAWVALAMGLSTMTIGGVSARQSDIAPLYAGAIFGLGNTGATLAGKMSTTFNSN